MNAHQRKAARKQKHLLEAGRHAEQERKALIAKLTEREDVAERLLEDLTTVKDASTVFEEDLAEAEALAIRQAETIREQAAELERAKGLLERAGAELVARRVMIDERDRVIAALASEERDAKKLRRRLQDAKAEIEARNIYIRTLRAELRKHVPLMAVRDPRIEAS